MEKLIIALCMLSAFLIEVPYLAQGSICESPEVQTKYGKVRGVVLNSRNDRPFSSYRRIPFAKPPIGDLRFKAPESPEPWNDIKDCTEDGPMCIQKNYLYHEFPEVEGQEDCLYINVHTPSLCANKQELLPVMVFINYGAFLTGTGRSDVLGPDYLIDEDVLLVTFNYRLGVFGLLSTNDDASPGNWAFKDQVAALKWVQENIAAFGGDNKQVTIFGQSAGSGSVHHLLLSPATKGLFQKAISQSGSALALWARPFNDVQASVAIQQAEFLNCSTKNGSEYMVNCLRGIDAVALANSADKFKYFSSEPLTVYGPVTEKLTEANPNPFITEDPLDVIKKGNFPKIPWMVGVVQDEGILRVSPFLRNRTTWKELNESFSQYMPTILSLAASTPEEIDQTWEKISDFFLHADFVDDTDPESVQGFIDMFSDRFFKYGSYQSVLLHAWKGHSTVWFYHFDYRGEYSYEKYFAGTDESPNFQWGVSHSDDLLYLFATPSLFEPLKSDDDIRMSEIMIQMWTDFVKKGDPSPRSTNATLQWNPIPNLEGREKVTNADLNYLNIGPKKSGDGKPFTFEIRNDFLTERMHFWESLPLAENIDGIE